jgi:hypothetical protein
MLQQKCDLKIKQIWWSKHWWNYDAFFTNENHLKIDKKTIFLWNNKKIIMMMYV